LQREREREKEKMPRRQREREKCVRFFGEKKREERNGLVVIRNRGSFNFERENIVMREKLFVERGRDLECHSHFVAPRPRFEENFFFPLFYYVYKNN
jgi:hypothetical protein